jgi:uncharacterized SAM-binding protein YcdF (DUF218 family)
MNCNRGFRALGAVTLLAFAFIAFTPLANILGNHLALPEDLGPADAIVVLGAGMGPAGELSRPSLKRTVRGIELYQLDYSPLLFLLGPAWNEGYPSEAEVRWRLARTMGMDPEHLLTEENGLNTREEARLSRERLFSLGVENILLVTEGQHLIRAVELFENEGFQVYPAPANDYATQPVGPGGRIGLMKRILEEQAARIYYRLAGYL